MHLIRSALAAILVFAAVPSIAAVRPASLFSDNMVLQQGRAVPVWGTADPGEAVSVNFAGQTVDTKAAADGHWMVRLHSLQTAETPALLTIAGTNTVTVRNVVVGEVWVCGGQSNMSMSLAAVRNGTADTAAATDSGIRMFNVPLKSSDTPLTDTTGSWAPATPQTAGAFSAVGYYFARELRSRLHEPIGMINSSVSGTRAEAWTGFETFRQLPTFHDRALVYQQQMALKAKDKAAYDAMRAKAQADLPAIKDAWYAKLDATDPGMLGKWMLPTMDVSKWTVVPLPGKYGDNPLGAYLGSLWCRKDVTIPQEWVGKDLELHIGAVDEADDTFVNGVKVGRTWFDYVDFWKIPRIYTVPASLVKTTKVTVVVRELNLYGDGGLFGPDAEMKMFPKGDTISAPVSLTGDWAYTFGLLLGGSDMPVAPGDPPGGPGAYPSGLYNGMIAPLVPYAIRGAVWYQGEFNADMPAEYGELLTGLIKSWRTAWGEGDFPFAIVQLPNYLTLQRLPAEKCSWAEIREAQRNVSLTVPNTTLAVTIDLGEPFNLHPPDKLDVGRRLALGVVAKTYAQPAEPYTGPMFKSMKLEGGKARLRFVEADGLTASGGPVGFAIAGADKVFHAARALIENDSVVVWADSVPSPIAVRYGWAMNPVGNLRNSASLPMVPFRTDTWSPREWTSTGEPIVPTGTVGRHGEAAPHPAPAAVPSAPAAVAAPTPPAAE